MMPKKMSDNSHDAKLNLRFTRERMSQQVSQQVTGV